MAADGCGHMRMELKLAEIEWLSCYVGSTPWWIWMTTMMLVAAGPCDHVLSLFMPSGRTNIPHPTIHFYEYHNELSNSQHQWSTNNWHRCVTRCDGWQHSQCFGARSAKNMGRYIATHKQRLYLIGTSHWRAAGPSGPCCLLWMPSGPTDRFTASTGQKKQDLLWTAVTEYKTWLVDVASWCL